MILHFESHSQNIRFSILFTFDFHFLHHSLTELFHNISPHSKCWYFHSLSFTQCTWTSHNSYNFWLEDVLFYMVYHLKTQSSCYFVICNCFNFIIFISDLTAGKCLIEIPFHREIQIKISLHFGCHIVSWLPSFLFFFPWAFTFSRKLSSYWGREHGPCDRPSLKNPRWFKLVACQKESYSDHGEKRHRDPCYIIKEEEAIFLSPPFPFLSFSFFFSTDLMTDNLVPKNVKTIFY